MLTYEQIDNLKPGDTLYLAVILEKKITHGTFKVKTDKDSYVTASTIRLSLPPEKPKYEPCRPFKKGDRAQVVERNGRPLTCFPVGRIKVGDIVTVAENETGDVFIKVLTEDGHEMMAPWFMLELVTPVEEQKPYKLIDSPNTYNIVRDGAMVMTIHKKSYPNAKAAAEAEHDRLNAEWRKEQK